jgi:hypothetical protein
VLKENVKLLGTAHDAHTRTTKCRVDNGQYQDKIKKARNYVYMSGGFLNGKYLENLLGPESTVPTHVRKMKFR